ncbi:hypothetical protein [Thiothrix fructosivorans]|uniref:Uncharacterized protein n=1 Tax=Thiothrix fructosivorans TaxID=111770 RepID=A0A8B0SJL1_9GAMM|nr:hypothetical protein [Thiothrix fructosivorans]MBO0611690.1 hypothetical protein [Thiothrix fructosivorans]QTX10650.1 hypothetical protein J1836_019130 [Thiothrix fructosivorans]
MNKFWVSIYALFAAAWVAVGNFHGGYSIATDIGFSGATPVVLGLMLVLVTAALFATYVTHSDKKKRLLFHWFSGLLMVIAASNFMYTAEVTTSSATGNAAAIDVQIAAQQSIKAAKQAELDGLANTVMGGRIQALRGQLSSAKAVTSKGRLVWDITAGCTLGGHPKNCSVIAQAQAALNDEVARVAGTKANTIRTDMAAVDVAIADLTTSKVASTTTAAKSGFISATFGVGADFMMMLIVVMYAAIVEMGTSHSFRVFALEFNPVEVATPEKTVLEALPVVGQLYADHKERALRSALVKAAAEGKEAARAKPEFKALVKAKTELAKEVAVVKRDIKSHIAHLTDVEVGKLIDKAGFSAGEKVDKFALRVTLHAAVKLFEAGGAIVQNGNTPMYAQLTTTVDVDGKPVEFTCSKHKLSTLILPAMEAAGFVEKVGKSYQWVSEAGMWVALGVEQEAPSKVDVNPEPAIKSDKSAQPKGLRVIEGGKR